MKAISNKLCASILLVTLAALIFLILVTTVFALNKPSQEPAECESGCTVPSVGIANDLLSGMHKAIEAAKCELMNGPQWPEDYAKMAIEAKQPLEYDFVIVGAGTAGSVVAARLSEMSNYDILVLEAGANPPTESEIPSLSSAMFQGTDYSWKELGEPQPESCQAMRDGRCVWTHCKMIGGTGGCNGNIFLLGNQENYDAWEGLGNPGWSWDDMQYYFAKATQNTDSDEAVTLNEFDSTNGYEEMVAMLYNATEELGLPKLTSWELGTRIGYTDHIPGTVSHGRRMSTGKTYLARAASKRNNLHVIKQAYVTQVLLSGNGADRHRAVGVEYLLPGQKKPLQVHVRRELIVSAGAINTPKILLLSGIGPKDELQKLGVQPLVDLPVGYNLQDHGMLPLMLKFTKEIQLPKFPNNTDPMEMAEYLLHQSGPLAKAFSFMGFIDSMALTQNDIGVYPDVHLTSHTILINGSTDSFQYLNWKQEIIDGYAAEVGSNNVMQIMGALLKPQTRGNISLRSINPTDAPRIKFNYGTHPSDKETLLRYIRYVQRLTETESFKKFGLKLVHVPIAECDILPANSNDYWLCYIRYTYIGTWHGVGTCRMGPVGDHNAVVDSRLHVHGIDAMRIVDASIMPLITSSNTNGPTIAIAEKGADMIIEDWRTSRFNRPIYERIKSNGITK